MIDLTRLLSDLEQLSEWLDQIDGSILIEDQLDALDDIRVESGRVARVIEATLQEAQGAEP